MRSESAWSLKKMSGASGHDSDGGGLTGGAGLAKGTVEDAFVRRYPADPRLGDERKHALADAPLGRPETPRAAPDSGLVKAHGGLDLPARVLGIRKRRRGQACLGVRLPRHLAVTEERGDGVVGGAPG